jgi:anti-sigma regulatory factor (Ser/Thr protein kinase)
MNNNVCKYGNESREGGIVCLKCSIDGDNCCLIRWCSIEQCIKMSNNFYKFGCKKVGVLDGEKQKDK